MVPLMLWATASQAALERSSSGRMTTWLRTPTRPFSRRQPMKVPFFFAMMRRPLPALGFEIVDVHVLALLDVLHEAADVLAVLDGGIALFQVGERDLVTDRDILLHGHGERRVVLRHHAEGLGAGRQSLDHHAGDIVLGAMRQDVGDAVLLACRLGALVR